MIKGLSNYFLMDILNKLVTFNGVFSIDNIPSSVLLKKHYAFICNLSRANEKGSHFITVIKKNNTITIHDSLALNHYPNLKLGNEQLIYKYHNPIQEITSSFCGFYCIYFVLTNLVSNKSVLTPFLKTQLHKNDEICIVNIENIIKHM